MGELAQHTDNAILNSVAAATSFGLAMRAAQYAMPVGVMLVAGLFAGFVAGLFGIGGGFVVVPLLAIVLTIHMPAAMSTSCTWP